MTTFSGCDKEVVKICEAFDLNIQEADWILFPENKGYQFESQGKLIKFEGRSEINEPYTFAYKTGFNPGRTTKCYSQYDSFYENRQDSLLISNSIGYENSDAKVFMSFSFNFLSLTLELRNDSIVEGEGTFSSESVEKYNIENLNSITLENKTFNNVVKITNLLEGKTPKEVYIAEKKGLVAYTISDSLWIRN